MLTLLDVWRALGVGPWPWTEAANAALTSVVIDSRLCVAGSLFVALRGERSDGHLYVEDAFQRGARAALVSRPVVGAVQNIEVAHRFGSNRMIGDRVCFVVDDTLCALQDLAAYWRRQFPACHVVGITGSVGKTTTKELIAAVLRQRFRTRKSEGNLNNEIGAPLTLLQLDAADEWLVQEMAMYGIGEIARLVHLAKPSIGVVTNVGPTHLERLGTLERIAEAKSELVRGLADDGMALLNGDDERVREMARLSSAKKVIFFGFSEGNDATARNVRSLGLEGVQAELSYKGYSRVCELPLLGTHAVPAALAAAVIGIELGMTWDQVLTGLRDVSAEARIRPRPGYAGSTILDDTYNASPDSVEAALMLLSQVPGRRVAVLGDMLELGSYEVQGHVRVGQYASRVVQELVTVGTRARVIAEQAILSGLPAGAVHPVISHQEAVAVLRGLLRKGDVVLVKGSRGMAMEMVVQELAEGAE